MRKGLMWPFSLSIVALVVSSVGPAAAAPECTVAGDRYNNRLVGTPGRDVLCGRGGDDYLIGKGGNDLLIGGTGDDLILGDAGNDSLKGGLGRDYIIGGGGGDVLLGFDGSEHCLYSRDGVRGNDTIRGGSGTDRYGADPGDHVFSAELSPSPAACPPYSWTPGGGLHA